MNEIENNLRSEWNKVAIALPTRGEELLNATEAFTDTVFVETLKAKQNQIIYGRRGTGKTHLLKRLEEEYIFKFDEYRVVPIFVNGSKLKIQANIIAETPQAIALSLYIEFIKTLVSNLHEFINLQLDASMQLDESILDKLFNRRQNQTAQKAQTIAKELNDLLVMGEVRFLPAGEASDEVQTLNETATKVSGGMDINLFDPRSIGWMVNLSARRNKEVKKSGVTFRTIKGQVILPFSQVAIMIQELLTLLDDSSLVVLFDEWSDIDYRLDTQPYLADMIKRTLSSITHMHVKLACIPIRTLLATPITPNNLIPIGYEEGDDISADVDLDSIICIQNDLEQFLPFFMILLKKHMGMTLEWVKSMEILEFEKFVCNEVFEGADVFSELCQASAGVPRDFLQLFRNATSIQVSLEAANLSLLHIRKAAAKLHESKRHSFKQESSELTLLDNIYRSIIAKQKTHLFLLKENHSRHPAIQMLWAKRLIHKMPASYYDSNTHIRYIYYLMDYGECVDLLSTEAAKRGSEQGEKMADSISGFSSLGWLGQVISVLAKEGLPLLMGCVEMNKTLKNQPAGNLAPDPKNIIVDDSIFEVSG